jgi:hypothetical protein
VVRYIGMDVHREFAQLPVAEDGLVRDEGRIGVTPEALRQWAAGLCSGRRSLCCAVRSLVRGRTGLTVP